MQTIPGHTPRPEIPMGPPQALVGVRPWGRWVILQRGAGFQVKLIEVLPGQRLSLQYHRHRSEVWVKVSGEAEAVVGGRRFAPGDLEPVVVPAGTVHRLGNPGQKLLRVIEVQQGDVISEDDIVRLEDDYDRVSSASA
jgi:mannose-6-phosphate isomerase-like protein (cupin superfamily)